MIFELTSVSTLNDVSSNVVHLVVAEPFAAPSAPERSSAVEEIIILLIVQAIGYHTFYIGIRPFIRIHGRRWFISWVF